MVDLNRHDLEFILRQIEIAEAHAAGTPLDELISHDLLPYGLRTVDGSYNNLGTGNELVGASSQIMPRLLDPVFSPAESRPANLHPGVPEGPPTSYAQTSGSVYDSQPRIISNLIVDQTIGNPATVVSALVAIGEDDPYAVLAVPANNAAYQAAVTAYNDAQAAGKALTLAVAGGDPEAIAEAEAALDAANAVKAGAYASLSDLLGVAFEGDTVVIPNVSADLGDTAPFNGFFTLFGQFFDHGLDLVSKGDSGTVYIPLQPDDPLYVPGSPTNFMVLTRATNQPGEDGILGTADDVHEHVNETTPWVDLNQVYTSNPSHQVFLREYVLVDGKPVATGRMLEGERGGPPTWADVKAQAAEVLGIELTDADVLRVPAVLTDLYGEFVRDENGMPQLVTATGFVSGNLEDPASASQALSAGRAFLNDIAHTAVPVLVDDDDDPLTPPVLAPDADSDAGNAVAVDNRGNNAEYDNELLDRHYIVGDGRGNENIGLTSIHHLFHHEHNRQVEEIKKTIVETGDLAFINEWLASDIAALPASQTEIDALVWDGERLFQAGRFSTEMVYQHLVFEEFARAVAPNIDPFLFSNTVDVDGAILAEFAHVVYRFGHSMLTENIDRLNLLLGESGEAAGVDADSIGLIEAFLNPLAYDASGVDSEAAAGAILRGMSRQAGNEIDEHITDALRNNLVGLPLDLATINMTRARETGVPSLNAARRDFYAQTQDSYLKPYESWFDFALAIKNPASLINFIAAYGTHQTILDAVTLEEKRAAATAIVLGGTGAPADRLDFLNGTGAWSSGPGGVTITGLDTVDFWIGGLAEKKMPFGGMLGSTFTFVFEAQLERLQEGDRFYYLSRTQGLNLLNELESDSFAELVMRNTDTGDSKIHMNGFAFQTADYVFEMDPSRQWNEGLGSADPIHSNPILQAISPMVIRQDVDGDGDLDLLRFTGGEHVVLGGTDEDDTLIGGEGDDTLWGEGGNDRLEGGFGVDHIKGGDGHDIITDSGTDVGAGDVLDGEAGDDFINGGMGLDLIFGGDGSDFLYGGSDDKTVSGGEGNDFISGPSGLSFLMGNEGDDWIEGGDSFDTLAGENSELFFNSTIIGHDVLNGRGNDTDYDGESGDDIMFQGPGIQRNNGMAGFDWAINKGNPEPADSDMTIKIFENQQDRILRDRFDLVEGLSGWDYNDVLIGREVVMGAADDANNAAIVDPDAPLDSYSSALLEKNLHLIDGLDRLVAHLERRQVTVAGVTETIVMDTDDASDIILGGGGSDLIRGNAGNDIIDGDAWLNVRILVSPDASRGQTWEAFSIDSLDEIHERASTGEIRGSQLQIVREILYTSNPGDIDTAVFAGNFINYSVVYLEDGTVIVSDLVGNEGTDRLTNIERLQFADTTITLGGTNNEPIGDLRILDDVTGEPVFSPSEDQVLRVDTSLVSDADGLGAFSFQWQVEEDPGTGIFIDIVNEKGTTFAPGDDQVGLAIRVVATFTDGNGIQERVISWTTTPVANVNDAPTGAIELSDLTPRVDQALLAITSQIEDVDGLGAFTYQWQQSADGGTTWVDIPGAITEVLFPGIDQAGQILRLALTYIDGGGALETVYSPATQVVGGVVFGGNGPDVLMGTDGEDIIFAEGGSDTVDGLAGNDTIDGGFGNDLLMGGDGDDVIDGGAGNDTLLGGSGDDTLTGGIGADSIDGGEGDDTIVYTAGDGAGSASGGEGTDTLEIVGTEGDDSLSVVFDGSVLTGVANGALSGIEIVTADLAGGTDTLSYGAATGADVAVDLDAGTASGFASIAGIENVTGGSGNDRLSGDAADNALTGGSGNDTLSGGLGADTLIGGGGSDTASYAGETDRMFVSLASGTARRGAADGDVEDILTSIENAIGGGGDDSLTGSTGTNTLDGGDGNDLIDGAAGNDVLSGGAGDDTLIGGIGNDTLIGGAGDDTFLYVFGHGTDAVDGGEGTDTLEIAGTEAGNTLSVTWDGTAIAAVTGASALDGIEAIVLDLAGGDTDTLNYAGSSADVTVNLATGEASGFASIAGVERVTGGSGNDVFVGDGAGGAANLFAGGAGDDTYYIDAGDRVTEGAGGGTDTVYSSASVLPLGANIENLVLTGDADLDGTGNGLANVITGNSGANRLSGGGGSDTLDGGDGNDTLNGDGGSDVLIGGAGDDTMNGGSGTDTFVFGPAFGNDVIAGFDANPGGGQDLLDISALGITSETFADLVTITDLGADTLVAISGGGTITLQGVNGTGQNVLTQQDFLLL